MGVAEKNPIQVGGRHGKLTVVEFIETRKECGTSQHYWRCLCDCGTLTVTRAAYLKNGHTRSCGCFLSGSDMPTWFPVKHGQARTVEYKTWQSMKDRCANPNNPKYKYYGARGITVCNEWQSSFETFWAYLVSTVGKKPKGRYSIDRIDNNRGYEPGNIRWATDKEQNNNRSNSVCNSPALPIS